MHTIQVSCTDENGRNRGGLFWLQDRDVNYESRRFTDAGYDVTLTHYNWVVTLETVGREQRASGKWVLAVDVDALVESLRNELEIMVFDAPGHKEALIHTIPPSHEEETDKETTQTQGE